MPDPFVFPAGASLAAFVMASIGWYGSIRNGVQMVHDDWKAAKKYQEDVGRMIFDLIDQKGGLERWKKDWNISKHTPDTILSMYWGEPEYSIIEHKLCLVKNETQEATKELGKITGLSREEWATMTEHKKKSKAKFILAKEKYLRKLIDGVPDAMKVIKEAADRGWKNQQPRLFAGISNNSPYHAQVALLLVQIAKQTQQDMNALLECTQALHNFSVELDLDLFEAISAVSQDAHSATVAAAAAAGHIKLDLLLRESTDPTAEIVRARVEKSSSAPASYARTVEAFRAVMTAPQTSVYHFALNATTIFSVCRCIRKGDPCSPARESLRQKLSYNAPPTYNIARNKLIPCRLLLGDVSTFRVAYELSQACLIFLRTTWLSELCGCGLRCGNRQQSSLDTWYEFGLNVESRHQKPLWRDLYPRPNASQEIEGEWKDSWCTTSSTWNTMTRPLRRLGLLLIEIALGTIILETMTNHSGSITHVFILVTGDRRNYIKQRINIEKAMKLVESAVHGSSGFSDAVRCCLTRVLQPAPVDTEWEDLLKTLYFDIVKP